MIAAGCRIVKRMNLGQGFLSGIIKVPDSHKGKSQNYVEKNKQKYNPQVQLKQGSVTFILALSQVNSFGSLNISGRLHYFPGNVFSRFVSRNFDSSGKPFIAAHI